MFNLNMRLIKNCLVLVVVMVGFLFALPRLSVIQALCNEDVGCKVCSGTTCYNTEDSGCNDSKNCCANNQDCGAPPTSGATPYCKSSCTCGCSSTSTSGGTCKACPTPFCYDWMHTDCACGCSKTISGGVCSACSAYCDSVRCPCGCSSNNTSGGVCNSCGGGTTGNCWCTSGGVCADSDPVNGSNCTSSTTSSCSCNGSNLYSGKTSKCGSTACGTSCVRDTSCDNPTCSESAPGCTKTSLNGANSCGEYGCNGCQRAISQITCNGSICSVQCAYDTECGTSCDGGGGGGGGGASCTITLLPSAVTVGVGASQIIDATVNVTGGSVSAVEFISSDPAIANVSPESDTSVVYSSFVEGNVLGEVTITGYAVVDGEALCSDTTIVSVTQPVSWWQVRDADVFASLSIMSLIPSSCVLPTCNPVFGLKGAGGYPGVVVYGRNLDFAAGSGKGDVAEEPNKWSADTQYGGKWYNYEYFINQLSNNIETNLNETPNVIDNNYINSGLSAAGGYIWLHYDGQSAGDLVIDGITLNNKKIVLLTENADIYVNGPIVLSNTATDFFMLVAGKGSNTLKGNVLIDANVAGSVGPEIEGLFLTESMFKTGAGTEQLHVRGSVVSYEGVLLERMLIDNSVTPSEYFEYAPELVQLFPTIFKQTRMRWKEVVP